MILILIFFFFYCFWVFGKILFNVFMRTEIGFVVFLHVAFMKSYGFFNPTKKNTQHNTECYRKKKVSWKINGNVGIVYYMSNL